MTAQTSYLLSPTDFGRLRNDNDALVGRLAVFIGNDGRIIMTRLGALEAMLNEAEHGMEYVLSLPFEKIGDTTIMGIAVSKKGEGEDSEIVGRLIDWRGAVHQGQSGTLFALNDYRDLPESQRERAFIQNMFMFWMRARHMLGGDQPWRFLRFNETPLELIGKTLGYASAVMHRPGKDEQPGPMPRDVIVGLFRLADGKVGVLLRNHLGGVLEIRYAPTGIWNHIVNGEPRPVVVSFPI